MPAGCGKLKRALLWLIAWLFMAASPSWASAPELEFHSPASADDAAAAATMRDLATRLLPIYQEPDPDRYLANLSALQMVSGNFAAADVSRQSLRNRRRSNARRPAGRGSIYDIYAYAKALETENRVAFAEAFARSFREVISRLSDQDAYAVTRWLEVSPAVAREDSAEVARPTADQGHHRTVRGGGVDLEIPCLRCLPELRPAGRSARRRGRSSALHDRGRCAGQNCRRCESVRFWWCVRRTSKAFPALLEFTIYDTKNYAMECAAHGYVGVVAYTRGKHTNPDSVVPYQHDGVDARRGDQLDRQAAMERRPGGNVRQWLQRLYPLGSRKEPAARAQGDCQSRPPTRRESMSPWGAASFRTPPTGGRPS